MTETYEQINIQIRDYKQQIADIVSRARDRAKSKGITLGSDIPEIYSKANNVTSNKWLDTTIEAGGISTVVKLIEASDDRKNYPEWVGAEYTFLDNKDKEDIDQKLDKISSLRQRARDADEIINPWEIPRLPNSYKEIFDEYKRMLPRNSEELEILAKLVNIIIFRNKAIKKEEIFERITSRRLVGEIIEKYETDKGITERYNELLNGEASKIFPLEFIKKICRGAEKHIKRHGGTIDINHYPAEIAISVIGRFYSYKYGNAMYEHPIEKLYDIVRRVKETEESSHNRYGRMDDNDYIFLIYKDNGENIFIRNMLSVYIRQAGNQNRFKITNEGIEFIIWYETITGGVNL